jgi:hypothetical protein
LTRSPRPSSRSSASAVMNMAALGLGDGTLDPGDRAELLQLALATLHGPRARQET